MSENNTEYQLKNQEFYAERKLLTEKYKTYEPEDIPAIKVGWQSRSNQYLGFEVATTFDGIDWQEINSVLDIGCGYGNLVEYLRQEKNFQGEYTGIELLPEFWEEAKRLYGNDSRNKFILGDFITHEWNQQKFDIVISLGTISINLDYPNEYGEKSTSYANESISLMIKLTKIAMSLYFVNSAHVPILERYINLNLACYSPEEIQEMIEKNSGKEYKSLNIVSYPEENNVKTIAKLRLV
ncbi:MAG TPA: methyltransferase domain-containing protein [Nostocaceae cyanobacterium]|nr:methyltransferase domain-containing protein [Nostocaceae cyanobacterium]